MKKVPMGCRIGDEVTRQMGIDGPIMRLKVSAVTPDRIICGPWEFDRFSGGEIDEDLSWDGYHTGSFLVRSPLVELSKFFHQTKLDIPGYTADMDTELRTVVEHEFTHGHFTYGYREGVVLVNVPTNHAIGSRVVKVDQNTEFVTVCKSRVPGEKPRKKTMALVDSLPTARYLKAVLYRCDVLEEDNDRSSGSEWEVVALLAQMDSDEPMNTATLMANHFKADGGTATNMSPQEFEAELRKSYDYWKDRSFGITKEEWSKHAN